MNKDVEVISTLSAVNSLNYKSQQQGVSPKSSHLGFKGSSYQQQFTRRRGSKGQRLSASKSNRSIGKGNLAPEPMKAMLLLESPEKSDHHLSSIKKATKEQIGEHFSET